jgi:hypothetical protein
MSRVPAMRRGTPSQCVIWPFKSTRELAYYRIIVTEIGNNSYLLRHDQNRHCDGVLRCVAGACDILWTWLKCVCWEYITLDSVLNWILNSQIHRTYRIDQSVGFLCDNEAQFILSTNQNASAVSNGFIHWEPNSRDAGVCVEAVGSATGIIGDGGRQIC